MNPLPIALTGLATGAGLIIAIGPQNVMVLRNGVARTHVVPIVAVCAVSDLVLILAGVVGLGAVVSGHPGIVTVATVLGAGYVIVLGLMAARRSLAPTAIASGEVTSRSGSRSRWAAVGAALALTWLNPHVYLDTVLTLGAIANSHGPEGKWAFAIGAGAASILWFCALGFAAGKLAPLFTRPRAWQILDAFVAVVMLAVGAMLLASL
ncbi:amino acid transporter [Williamsia sp. Leaf354]|uniref:LysE/ArgO family amino acid transporter n=1 Tax=Williamsia sp. Leaf354 TaxID=1736349 RepID=UPI0007016C49|nr:LysE/ArgO family amino acid transporter [Williamsia sp. Leaf354]KQR99710.1 amino acid transporter [Williamsia sp. Leaf354]